MLAAAVTPLLGGISGFPAQAAGAAYPAKPIRLIVPFSAGSATDQLARALGNIVAIAEVVAGRIEMMVVDTGTCLPFIKSGKVRALGVTNMVRSPLLPDVPSIGDTVRGYDVSHYFGLWGPAGLSSELTARINGLFVRAVKSEAANTGFYSISGTAPRTMTPQEMAAYQLTDAQTYGRIIRGAGIAPE